MDRPVDHPATARMRIDKWLWAARLFKTRALANAAADAGKVQVNGIAAKPAREIAPGDTVRISMGQVRWELVVCRLSDRRGPANIAQHLYQETEQSRAAREAQRERSRLAGEPAAGIRGRPTKRDRRHLDRASGGS